MLREGIYRDEFGCAHRSIKNHRTHDTLTRKMGYNSSTCVTTDYSSGPAADGMLASPFGSYTLCYTWIYKRMPYRSLPASTAPFPSIDASLANRGQPLPEPDTTVFSLRPETPLYWLYFRFRGFCGLICSQHAFLLPTEAPRCMMNRDKEWTAASGARMMEGASFAFVRSNLRLQHFLYINTTTGYLWLRG